MRVRLVARLLAVMLASPVVAFTRAGEGVTIEAISAPANRGVVEVRASPELPSASPQRAPEPPAEVRISVECGHDGCVVQEGLAVLVLAEAPPR